MRETLLNFNIYRKHFPLSCCLVLLFLITHIYAETIIVQGTVSVSTTTVKNDKVSFIAAHNSTVQYSTITDDAGKYQTVTLYNGDVHMVTPFTTSKKRTV